jgi:polygalacturonase
LSIAVNKKEVVHLFWSIFKFRQSLYALLALIVLAGVCIMPQSGVQAAELNGSAVQAAGGPAGIYAYQPSERYSASSNYTLKANGVEIPVIKGFSDYDYAHFSASGGAITYELTILNTDKVHEYSISPKKLGLKADKVEGRTITFTTQKDEYLIIMMNSRATRMVIAADPAETDAPPSSGQGIFNITAAPYSVVADGSLTGVAGRTAAIQRAIDDAGHYGTAQGYGTQGIVYVPAGTYYIGNLVLKSNTALYMEPGATFAGTGRTADYTEHWYKDSKQKPVTWWISTAFQSDNIKLYGRGTLDGNGQALHDDKSTNGKGMINNLVVPIATSNFKMDGITVRHSSAWAVTPIRSHDLEFTNLKMFNSLSMGENDGIDICESQNVVVRNSIGIALDDPYSTKTWQENTDIASGKVPWPGNPQPVRNVLIEDAISWTLCYGFKIGQGVMQLQDGVTFRDGVVYKAAVGFAVHHKYGTGTASNVRFENIDVEDISGKNDDNSAWMTLFTVNASGNGVGPITGVTVKNITVRDAGESFAKLKGQEGAMITGVTFENVYMPGSTKPASTLHEMNFLDKEYYSGVTIKPVQNPEPTPKTNLAEVKLYWEAAYGKSYQIQVSDDASQWTDEYSTTNGKGGIETVTFNEVNARYVRMYGTERATKYGYSLWELEVYGPE